MNFVRMTKLMEYKDHVAQFYVYFGGDDSVLTDLFSFCITIRSKK